MAAMSTCTTVSWARRFTARRARAVLARGGGVVDDFRANTDSKPTAYVNEHRSNGYNTRGRNLAGGSDVTAAGAHNTGSTGGLALPYHAHQSSVPTSHQASGVTRAGPLRCRGSYVETSTRPVLRWPGDLALCSDQAQMTSTSSSSSSSVAISLGVVW